MVVVVTVVVVVVVVVVNDARVGCCGGVVDDVDGYDDGDDAADVDAVADDGDERVAINVKLTNVFKHSRSYPF